MDVQRPGASSGFTLIELSIVVAILVVIVSTTILSVSPVQIIAVDEPANELEAGLRFARQHAAKLSIPTLVTIDSASKMLSIYQVNFNASPATGTLVMHPLKKVPYQVQLGQKSLGAADIQVHSLFTFADGTSSSNIGFLPNGRPGKLVSGTQVVSLSEPYLWRGAWQSGVSYGKGDIVENADGDYVALQGHTSGSDFTVDLTNNRWIRNDVQAPQITISVGAHQKRIHIAPITGMVRVQPR